MRVNWMVPVRGLYSLSKRILKLAWVPIEIAITIPLVPLIYLLVLIATGFEVTCRKVRKLFMVADFALTDTMFDEFGHVWANVEGKAGLDSFAVNKYTSLTLVDEGIVIKLEHDKNRYLAPYLEHDHSPKAIAIVLAGIFINQDISNIKPVSYNL